MGKIKNQKRGIIVYMDGYVGKQKKSFHYFFNKDTGKIHLDRIKWKEEW